jgi:hypothetical protein
MNEARDYLLDVNQTFLSLNNKRTIIIECIFLKKVNNSEENTEQIEAHIFSPVKQKFLLLYRSYFY